MRRARYLWHRIWRHQRMKMDMIYNNTSKLDRLLSNGHNVLGHLGHL
jgi:hypothetical protein